MKRTLALLPLVVALAACSGGETPVENTAPTKPLLLLSQDLLTVEMGELAQGPVVSGSLQPERQADLRAEVSGVVLQVHKDNGDLVKKGDLLLVIDPTAIRDQLLSAQEAERAADIALDQAERQLKRWTSMSKKGLVAAETLEGAELKRNQSQSELASARARVVEARQRLEKTEVRAPFDGILSGRLVSAGDTAQVGKELMKVVDPRSMRFEGFVAADQAGRVKVGDGVNFRVNGYAGKTFEGGVQRINPIADAMTRQVQMLVSVPTDEQLVAGLYAEGMVRVASESAILVPESALVQDGDTHFVWRLRAASLSRIPVVLGQRNERDGRYAIRSGLTAGEQVLRHPQGALKDGGKVQLADKAMGGAPVVASASAGE
ncbi:MAG: efflux RND transporter periplasmic adaptor subunit [Gammaproteobacteria bacterium]|nr:efflux RND transporter periplasmic adaptor subunit [Gammaproteobacteria bacterium]